jgi:hypothetical protein
MANERDVYNSSYEFAKREREAAIKRLKIISVTFPLVILTILGGSFLSSFIRSRNKSDIVTEVFPKQKDEEKVMTDEQNKIAAYKAVKIPYEDPNSKFSIIFVTPYASGDIAVVIKSNKDYYDIKREADEIIKEARKDVRITSVSYINNAKD